MNRVFKELPTVLPFYTSLQQQSRFRENSPDDPFKLISPRNGMLPFQIEVDSTKPAPFAFYIVGLDGVTEIELQLNQLAVYEYNGTKKVIYKGDPIKKANGTAIYLQCGYYYARLSFNEGTNPNHIYSEVFYVPQDNFATQSTSFGKYVKFEFWNDSDIEPVIYRNNFRQRIFLDTFVSAFSPEIEEEAEKDGENSPIPTFQKMTTKYKVYDYVPNFVKTALISMQMHDYVTITTNDGRTGELKRILINVTPDEDGFMDAVEIIFDDEMMIKTHCDDQKPYINTGTW